MESGEHKIIGDSSGLSGLPANALPVQGQTLTYGHVVALGGDFYGVPAEPICQGANGVEREVRFAKALGTLLAPTSVFGPVVGQAELAELKGLIDDEVTLLQPAIANPTPTGASDIYKAYSTSSAWPTLYTMGSYPMLAANNLDHFGVHAQMAYLAGHRLAIALAIAAHNKSSKVPGFTPPAGMLMPVVSLADAYLANAFADHFLTDLFSAGHLRTPRGDLHNWSNVGIPKLGWAGDVLSWYAHDEDCKYGLHVSNATSSWFMYGDKRVFDSVNSIGRANAEAAVKASKDEVFAAYQTGVDPFAGIPLDAPPASVPAAALAIAPDPTKAQDWRSNPDHRILFRFTGGTILSRRDDVNDLACLTYTGCTTGPDTWGYLKIHYTL